MTPIRAEDFGTDDVFKFSTAPFVCPVRQIFDDNCVCLVNSPVEMMWTHGVVLVSI